jgi:hypothetical protein
VIEHEFSSAPSARHTQNSASSPQQLAWLDDWNQGNPYEEQIKPFGLLLACMP